VDFLSLYYQLLSLIQQIEIWTVQFIDTLVVYLGTLIGAIESALSAIVGFLAEIGRVLARVARAAWHFVVSDLWAEIQRWYGRFKNWIDWYRKHVLAPLDQVYRNIIHLYDQFFRPIIKFIDDLRRLTQIIALFNRRLAAKIDNALFQLEYRIMQPLLDVLHRVNSIASIQAAYLTRLGLFARPVLLESIQRDWKLMWRVLLNGGQAPAAPPASVPGLTSADLVSDWRAFVDAGSGRFADQNDKLGQAWNDALVKFG